MKYWYWDLVFTKLFLIGFCSFNVITVLTQLQKWRNGGHFEILNLKTLKLTYLRNEKWYWDLGFTKLFLIRFCSFNILTVLTQLQKWRNGGHFEILNLKTLKLTYLRNEKWYWYLVFTKLFLIKFCSFNVITVLTQLLKKWQPFWNFEFKIVLFPLQ